MCGRIAATGGNARGSAHADTLAACNCQNWFIRFHEADEENRQIAFMTINIG